MNQDDYRAQDATGLAALIATRQVSAAEVLEAALARAEAVNPTLNAIILSLEVEARAHVAGGTPDGPLGGVPWLIKDIGAQLAGTPTTAGSRLLKDAVAPADSAIVTAYRKAGLVIFGKTNTPEFGLEPVTEPELFGPTLNPWSLDHTPGGSSGGAAAAVAAGIVPAAHASDGGGSIRTPASCCGLFGLKPSRGRVSFAPADEGWGGFSIQHAVTRTVRDSAALLDAVCAPVDGDPYWLAPPATPFAGEVGRDPGRLRVGFIKGGVAGETIDPECAAAVADVAKLCAGLGHEVEEVRLEVDFPAMREAAGAVIAASITATLDAETARRGRPVEDGEVDRVTRAMYARGQRVSGAVYVQAMQTAHAAGRAMARTLGRFDVLLCSTLGSPPILKGSLRGEPLDLPGYADRLFAFMTNTQLANVTGQPAMSVPLAWSRAGLPIGIQFMGRPGDEATLLRLAGQLEATRPWADRRAPFKG
ncbi:MAG: amidase [Caulobacter sp.]|nr:amidase [Caulobacter sp.]